MGVGMGLNMNLKQTLFISLIIAGLISATSCVKKEDLSAQDLGPAISPDDIQSKMSASIGNLNYYDLREQETSRTVASTSLQGGKPVNRYVQDLKVNKITDTPTTLTLDFVFDKQDLIQSEKSFVNQPYSMVLDKGDSTLQNSGATQFNIHQKAADDNTPVPFFMYKAYLYFAIQGCRESGVNCYNLSIKNSQMILNPQLASPSICADVNNCVVDVNQIEFDMLDQSVATSDGKPYRSHYTFVVTPQFPFLSKVWKYCSRGLANTGTQEVLVEECMSVNSFSSGQIQ